MSTTTNLKAHARALEQQEQWSAALEVYEQLAAEQTPGEDLDVGLWNRIGDLHMRLGQSAPAVDAYERAVEAYEEAGLHNNALALCGKILRIAPNRSTIYLKLGVISAMKGFAADARAHLQRFVEHASRGDQLEKALGTLLDTARGRLADAEVLQAMAGQLREHGWADRLEIELGPECDRLRAEGLVEEAERARAVLDGEELPPSTARIEEPPLASSRMADGDQEDDMVAIELEVPLTAASEDDPTESSDPQHGDVAADAELLEINPLEGLQTTHVGAGDDDLEIAEDSGEEATVAGFETGSADSDEVDAADAELAALPLLTFQPELDVDALAALDLSIELTGEGADETAGFDAAGFRDDEDPAATGDDEDEPADDDDLPLLGLDSFAAPADDAGTDGEDASDHLPLIGLSGELEESTASPEELEVVDGPEHEEEDVAATAPPPAAASAETEETPTEGPTAEDPEEYIDLSSLIFEDDDPATTRFVVDAEEPTGDEDKDFAEMLARFREQVAKNIDADDNSSHYDLGVAFKEMGLLDEAISEFQTALRAGSNPLATMEMLGECFIEKGQHAVAWRILDQAVRLSGVPDADLVGILYWMGRCEEALGRSETACECYERVLSVDIRFRDAGSRLSTLRS